MKAGKECDCGIKIFEISTLGWHRDGCQPRVLAQFD